MFHWTLFFLCSFYSPSIFFQRSHCCHHCSVWVRLLDWSLSQTSLYGLKHISHSFSTLSTSPNQSHDHSWNNNDVTHYYAHDVIVQSTVFSSTTLLLLFKFVISTPFCLFLFFSLSLSSLCSLSQSSLFSLSSFPLDSPASLLFLLINSLLR